MRGTGGRFDGVSESPATNWLACGACIKAKVSSCTWVTKRKEETGGLVYVNAVAGYDSPCASRGVTWIGVLGGRYAECYKASLVIQERTSDDATTLRGKKFQETANYWGNVEALTSCVKATYCGGKAMPTVGDTTADKMCWGNSEKRHGVFLQRCSQCPSVGQTKKRMHCSEGTVNNRLTTRQAIFIHTRG